LTVQAISNLSLQKVHKEILKLIHMNWLVLSKFSEETQSLFMMNIVLGYHCYRRGRFF